MLQQADDFAPGGQVMAECAVEVEEAHGVGEAGAVFEKTDKAFAVFRIIVEMVVDFAGGFPPVAQCARGDGDDAVALLYDFQNAENVFGLFGKQVFIVGSDLVADLIIIVVDLVHHARQNGKHAAT